VGWSGGQAAGRLNDYSHPAERPPRVSGRGAVERASQDVGRAIERLELLRRDVRPQPRQLGDTRPARRDAALRRDTRARLPLATAPLLHGPGDRRRVRVAAGRGRRLPRRAARRPSRRCDRALDDVLQRPRRLRPRAHGGTPHVVPRPAMPSRSLARDERRHASSSVAPIPSGIEAPCVLAWLAPRTPGTRPHH
jgi:hypothetical protein